MDSPEKIKKSICEINLAKKEKLTDLVLNSKGNTKKLYQIVSKLTGSVKDNPLPKAENDKKLANDFADFFLQKIKKIRDDLDNIPNYNPEYLEMEIPALTIFEELSQNEVKDIINNLGTKSCELDAIPTKILKKCLSSLLPSITEIVNLSLASVMFPSNYKEAIIRPLLKKPGLDLHCSNYRPVSNLPFMSKIIEKAMLLRFNKHCQDYNLLPNNQSAYRPTFSCETALLRLANDILVAMETKQITSLLAIDLSAAFDTVDHSVLLNVLEKKFFISETALNWVSSYLRPRSFKIKVGNDFSAPRLLEFCVPKIQNLLTLNQVQYQL